MKVTLKKLMSYLYKKETLEVTEIHNSELVSKLRSLLYVEGLDSLLSNTINRRCLMNTYTNDINELTGSLNRRLVDRGIIAIDVCSYMKGNESRIYTLIERIIPVLEKTKLSDKIINDITELIDTINFFRGVET